MRIATSGTAPASANGDSKREHMQRSVGVGDEPLSVATTSERLSASRP
jgi:hypothetical protein